MSLLRHRELLPAISVAPVRPRPSPARVAQAESIHATLMPVLYFWLCCGGIGCALFPSLRGADPMIGWWPFWLLLWPAASMLLLWVWRRRGIGAGARRPVFTGPAG